MLQHLSQALGGAVSLFPNLVLLALSGRVSAETVHDHAEAAMRTSPPQLVLVVVVHQAPGVNYVHQSGGQETVVPVDERQPLVLQLNPVRKTQTFSRHGKFKKSPSAGD